MKPRGVLLCLAFYFLIILCLTESRMCLRLGPCTGEPDPVAASLVVMPLTDTTSAPTPSLIVHDTAAAATSSLLDKNTSLLDRNTTTSSHADKLLPFLLQDSPMPLMFLGRKPSPPPYIPSTRDLCWQNPARPIIVYHSPKAGGTAARDFLKRACLSDRTRKTFFSDVNMQQNCAHGAAWPLSVAVYIGHFGTGVSDQAPPLSSTLQIVLVREPISRIYSWIEYMIEQRRAPQEWSSRPFVQSMTEYIQIRQGPNAHRMDLPPQISNLSLSSHLIHHVLTEQLSILASYRCVNPTPDVNPFNCSRPRPVIFASDTVESSELDEFCSMANMKQMAMHNVKYGVDFIVTQDRFDFLTKIARVNLQFGAYNVFPRSQNRAMDSQYLRRLKTPELDAILRVLLKDEIEVYAQAKARSLKQEAVIDQCPKK